MGNGQTPGELLAGNIAAAMARRRLAQPDLAARMQELGHKWLRQTAGDVLTGRRSLRASELYAVALSLETSIPMLMAPVDVDDGKTIDFPSGLEISAMAVKMLTQGLTSIGAAWHGNKLALSTPAIPVERFRQVFGDSALERPRPR